MLTSSLKFVGWVGTCALGAAALLATHPAQAQVFQTDAAKTPLPQPVGMNEFNLVTNAWAYNTMVQVNTDATGTNVNQLMKHYSDYFPTFVDGDAITLAGLFKFRGEKIDPVADAHTEPGYFSPSCGFTGQLLLRGGDCEISFGWYNVEDPASTTPPTADQIYPFIPTAGSTITADLQCKPPIANGFCPLAWDPGEPRDLSNKLWVPKAYDSGSIKTDPNYKGKYVGFAVIGKAGTACSQNKYSMLAYNQKNASGQPWVTTLIYHSTVDPDGFYMAFEDLPMSAADWHQTGVPGNQATNDGDFNDFVFYVSGISCTGGNQPCTTTLKGACSVGHTDCAVGDTPGACRPVVQPSPETCDNVDNDCDGVIDNGDNLCASTPDTPICFQGMCVGNCSRGEFPCPDGTTCDASGHCVDAKCSGITCDMGKACKAGTCVDPCDNVTCPYGSQCELGHCIDPCLGVTCPAGRVCEKGLCLAACGCRACADGLTCGADGKCTDTACASVSCMSGMVCRAGSCVDPCAGVACPGGAACNMGVCGDPSTGGSSSVVNLDGGLINNTGGSGIDFPSGGGAGGSVGRLSPAIPQKGCGCRVGQTESDRSSTLPWLGAALGLAMASCARRRRHRSRRAA
jgi:hypothetical protein